MPRHDTYLPRDKSSRFAGAGMAIALHAALLAVLLQFQPVRSALTQMAPIMVSLITPPQIVEKPQELPRPLPVKRQIERPRPKPDPQPLLSAITEAPAPFAAPAPQPEAPPAPPPQPAPVVAAPAPAPIIPPNFNADYLDNPPPVYPATARRMGQQGRVVLRVLVNTGGTADKVELRTSSGSNVLDDAALGAVRRWRFVPAKQGEKPLAAWVLVPITFTLEG